MVDQGVIFGKNKGRAPGKGASGGSVLGTMQSCLVFHQVLGKDLKCIHINFWMLP